MEPAPNPHSSASGVRPGGAIPSGSLRLDVALGTGGIPRGWITEIFGVDQAGKTTLCLHLAAAAQRHGGLCAWVDADQTLDPVYALHCGVDPDRLFLVEPQDAEQAMTIVQSLVQSDCLDLIVVDSAGSLVTRAEMVMPLGRQPASGIDRLLARSLPGLALAAQNTQTALVFTNRSWPGTPPVYHHLNQQPEKLALKLQAAIRLQVLQCRMSLGPGAVSVGTIQARCVKNKFFANFPAIQVDIVYNETCHIPGDIFDLSSAFSIVHLQDSRYYYQKHRLGESRAEAIEALKQNRHLAEEIEDVVRQKLTKMAR
jgi:recombination protein RecA